MFYLYSKLTILLKNIYFISRNKFAAEYSLDPHTVNACANKKRRALFSVRALFFMQFIQCAKDKNELHGNL